MSCKGGRTFRGSGAWAISVTCLGVARVPKAPANDEQTPTLTGESSLGEEETRIYNERPVLASPQASCPELPGLYFRYWCHRLVQQNDACLFRLTTPHIASHTLKMAPGKGSNLKRGLVRGPVGRTIFLSVDTSGSNDFSLARQ